MPGKSSKHHESDGSKKRSDNYIFSNGEKYVGEYIDCGNGVIERHGEGTHSFADGRIYKGSWSKDKMNGTGEMVHPNGSSYKGAFVDNEYHGNGVFLWPDGATFTGQFANNRIAGSGEYKDTVGRTWVGNVDDSANSLLHLKLS